MAANETSPWMAPELEFDESVPAEKVGAFFDIDETLVRGATAYWAAKEMFRRSVVDLKEVGYVARHTLYYLLFGESSKDKVASLIDRAARIIEGIELADVEPLAEEVYEQYFVPKVYRATYERLREHVEAGHAVYLVSATPWLIAESLARALGAAGGIGTRTKILDGKFSGELEGGLIHGEGKAVEARRVAKELGLDLDQSWAYSDSANDIPLLSLVGNPVAVNPDRKLAAHARNSGWPAVRAYDKVDVVKRVAGKTLVTAVAAGVLYLGLKSARRGGSALGRAARGHSSRRRAPLGGVE